MVFRGESSPDSRRYNAPTVDEIGLLVVGGYKPTFNLIKLHSDAGYIETTVRHFLDLMESTASPLREQSGERTACIDTIIYLLNQLFLSNNDLISLDWIEKEHSQTARRKWDGVLSDKNNKQQAAAFIEFSGGIKINATIHKECTDIVKLYTSMLQVLKDANNDDDTPKKLFCARYHDDNIYLEELLVYGGSYLRRKGYCYLHNAQLLPAQL